MMFLLFVLVLSTSADLLYNTILSHVKTKVDTSVSPCDDFYKHVCPSDLKQSDFFKTKILRETNKKLLANYPTDYDQLIDAYKSDMGGTKMHDRTEDEFEKHLLGRCSNPVALDEYYAMVVGPDEKMKCEKKAETIHDILTNSTFKESMEKEASKNVLPALKKLADLVAWQSYVNKSGEEFKWRAKQASDMLNLYRTKLIGLLQETQWVNENKLGEKVEKLISGISLYDWPPSEVPKTLLSEVLAFYEYCRTNVSSGLFEVEVNLCLNTGYFYIENGDGLTGDEFDAWSHGITSVQANYFTNDNSMILRPPLYEALALNDSYAVMGTIGHVIGHELSHSVLMNNRNVLTKYMPDGVECIKKHSENMCGIFADGKPCVSGRQTAGEDVADLNGLQLAEIIAKTGKIDTAHSEPTGMKLFYYALATASCAQHAGSSNGDNHASPNVRLNAMLIHSSEFRQTFQCTEDSRMASEHPSCFIW